MAREIPEVVRAAAGLAAIVLDEARKLPETLPGLPVRVIGLAMQQAMKVQQQYAGFVARGDELFTGLRGEDEPGLATFDDEVEDSDAPAAGGGFRESAFDRADVPLEEVPLTEDTTPDPTDLGDSDLPAVDLDTVDESAALPPAKAARAAKKAAATAPAKKAPAKKAPAKKAAAKKTAPPTKADASRRPRKGTLEAAAQVEEAQQSLDALPAEAPATDEVLEELAIEEMVAETPPAEAPEVTEVTEVTEPDVTADVSTTTDDLAEGEAAAAPAEAPAAEAAAPETTAPETAASQAPTTAPTTAPIDGYDDFSIAQLRGRLRGYALSTVADLVAYEESSRSREPYLRMLRNRLERLEAQAVESSPLAPRGA